MKFRYPLFILVFIKSLLLFADTPEEKMFDAVWEGNTENLINVFKSEKPDPNAVNEIGQTALCIATDLDLTEIIDVLLAHGSDINLAGSNGETPLAIAIEGNQIEMLNFLLDNGAFSVDANNEQPPLFFAIEASSHSSIQILCERNLDDINAPYNGATPLTLSTILEEEVIVKQLLNFGADPRKSDSAGNTPLELAINLGNTYIAEKILKKVPDLKITEELLAIVRENGSVDMYDLFF